MNRLIYYIFLTVALSGCSGCSRSGNRADMRRGRTHLDRKIHSNISSETQPAEKETQPLLKVRGSGTNVVAMLQENGVYKIPVNINGVPMQFIIDTGASQISISSTEAAFLYKQGTIMADDIIGTAQFSDANGDISPGTIIRLHTVKIGNRTLENVNAFVVENSVAPLLLGQSALAQFGKLSIDYNKGVVEFE